MAAVSNAIKTQDVDLSLRVVAAAVDASNRVAIARMGLPQHHDWGARALQLVQEVWATTPLQSQTTPSAYCLHHNTIPSGSTTTGDCDDNGQNLCETLCSQHYLLVIIKSTTSSRMIMINAIHCVWTKWVKAQRKVPSPNASFLSPPLRSVPWHRPVVVSYWRYLIDAVVDDVLTDAYYTVMHHAAAQSTLSHPQQQFLTIASRDHGGNLYNEPMRMWI